MEQIIPQQDKSKWIAVQGTVTGRSHIKENTVCQDKTSILYKNGILAASLADGAGSAKFSHLGAQAVTIKVCETLCDNFDDLFSCTSVRAIKNRVVEDVSSALDTVIKKKNCEMNDLSSTLLAVAISGDKFLVFHLGDGVIGYIKNDSLLVATAPVNGEFINMTYFTTSSEAGEVMQFRRGQSKDISGFILMSDGCEAGLYNRKKKNLAPVLSRLLKNLATTSERYMQPIIQRSLENAISLRTNDDCGLVLVARQDYSYAGMNEQELDDFFDIQEYGDSVKEKKRNRYLKILNTLKTPHSGPELSRRMNIKSKRFLYQNGLKPLIDMGFVEKHNGKFERTIDP